MALDVLLKKYFAGVILALVSVAAYFQAKGTTQLISVGMGPTEAALAKVPPAAIDPASLRGKTKKDAEPILARNPFDSVKGPLNAQPIDMPQATASPTGPVDTKDPLGAPPCEGTRVEIVTESTDPLWSLAALQGPGEPQATIRRVGDKVGAREVAYIGYNWRETSPAVWLAGGSSLCQALLFAEQPAPAPAAAKPKPGKPTPAKGKGKKRGPTKLPKELADKIQKVSETEFNVDRAVVDKILENQAELMRSARIVPEQKDGKVVGIRMFGIRPDTLLGTLGFQNGDRLESINGFDMTSPEKALEAYARLRTAKGLSVKVNRRGKPMTVDYKIK